MVRLSDFDKIVYRKPRFFPNDRSLENIVGFDSEAYRDGTTFMFCTSNKDVIAPDDLIETLFSTYGGTNFVVWNLKYESGAILKLFPREVIKTLQMEHRAKCTYRSLKLTISYIPHKRLLIKHRTFQGKSVKFWDMSPFYGRRKLETAASDYLNEHKDDIDPTLFTHYYVNKNFQSISAYCIQDAVLTQRLAVLWIDKFQETGIPVTSLYSEASISFAYISRKADIVTPHEFWDYNRTVIRYAFESYEGGKFEIYKRGAFTGYEYDISSAYPNEIANLVDIRGSHPVYTTSYLPEATYGFLRVRIRFTDPNVHLPCGLFKTLRIYPTGDYYVTITKQEYDYIVTLPQVKVKIVHAAWLVIPKITYPYKEVITELYEMKTKYKKSDRLRSNNYKIIMNGFYGKMAQCLLDPDGSYHAGQGWNPIYASIITANTRIAITRLQNILGPHCLAVHTDSVITTKPIPAPFIGSKLGQFDLVEQGNGVLVACGIYEINGQSALKGFRKYSVTKILQENPNKKRITLSLKHVESWLQAMAQNHDPSSINLFSDVPKILTLNCDTKRQWPEDMNSTDFLTTLQSSLPLSEIHKEKPDYWK